MFHFAIVSNSASRLFSTGSSLHLVPLSLFRSLHFSTCCPLHAGYAGFRFAALDCIYTMCKLHLCRIGLRRVGLRRACDLEKGSQFYYNKNFFKMQMNILYALPHRYKSYLAFVLYVYRKIFSLFLFKIFWKFFLEGLGI